jgi:hypothetical protein
VYGTNRYVQRTGKRQNEEIEKVQFTVYRSLVLPLLFLWDNEPIPSSHPLATKSVRIYCELETEKPGECLSPGQDFLI